MDVYRIMARAFPHLFPPGHKPRDIRRIKAALKGTSQEEKADLLCLWTEHLLRGCEPWLGLFHAGVELRRSKPPLQGGLEYPTYSDPGDEPPFFSELFLEKLKDIHPDAPLYLTLRSQGFTTKEILGDPPKGIPSLLPNWNLSPSAWEPYPTRGYGPAIRRLFETT